MKELEKASIFHNNLKYSLAKYVKDRNKNTQLDVIEVYKGRGFKLLSFEPGELLWKRAISRLTKADLEKIVGYEFELAED